MEKENIQVNDSGREGMQGAPGLQEEESFRKSRDCRERESFRKSRDCREKESFRKSRDCRDRKNKCSRAGKILRKPRRIPDMERGRCILMGSQMHLLPEQVMVHRGQDMVLLERATVHRKQARVRLHTRGQVLCQSARKY